MPVIDLETDSVIAKVPVKSDGGRAVAFTPDNACALLTLGRIPQKAVVDTEEPTTTRYIPVGPGPRGIAVAIPRGPVRLPCVREGANRDARSQSPYPRQCQTIWKYRLSRV
jgi:hypothetical protein